MIIFFLVFMVNSKQNSNLLEMLEIMFFFFFVPGGCANVTCEFYSACKSQGIGQPGLCVCPTDCVEEVQDVMIVEKDTNKVCGTDGQTYESECLLKIAACNKQQYVVVANKGECGKFLRNSNK